MATMTPEELEQLTQDVIAKQAALAAAQSHLHYDGPAIQINPATGFAKEMRKWEAHHGPYGPPGRPYPPPGVSTEYPRAMFKFGHPEGRPGAIVMLDTRDCRSDSERERMERDGYRATQEEAHAAVVEWDREMARAEAIGNHEDRLMSAKAKEEREAALMAAEGHVAEIPRAHPKTGRRDPS